MMNFKRNKVDICVPLKSLNKDKSYNIRNMKELKNQFLPSTLNNGNNMNSNMNGNTNILNAVYDTSSKKKLMENIRREQEDHSKIGNCSKQFRKTNYLKNGSKLNNFPKNIGNNFGKTNTFSLSEFSTSDRIQGKHKDFNLLRDSQKINMKEFNSLYSFDNTITTTNNSIEDCVFNDKKRGSSMARDMIQLKSKKNIRLYSKPQMILVEDSTYSSNDNNTAKYNIFKTINLNINNLNLNLKKQNLDKMRETLSQKYRAGSKTLKPDLNRKKNNHQNYKGNNELKELFCSANLNDRCTSIDNVIYENKSNSNFFPYETLIKKTASYENFDKTTYNKTSLFRKSSRPNYKHELRKNIQQTLDNVKLDTHGDLIDHEKLFDQLFSSLELSRNNNQKKSDNNQENSINSLSKLDEEKNNSGILSYSEVKDIIVSYDFEDYGIEDRNLFYKNDYRIFGTRIKQKYLNSLLSIPGELFENIKKSKSTKESSLIKN